jgi:hypothetical protein
MASPTGFEPVMRLDQNGSTTIRKELAGGSGGAKSPRVETIEMFAGGGGGRLRPTPRRGLGVT